MIYPSAMLVQYLKPRVGVPVSTKVPATRPDLFVRVEVGAPQHLNLVGRRTMVIIQVYGTNLTRVLETMELVKSHLDVIEMVVPEASGFDTSEWLGPVDFPDPDLSDVHRWQLTGQLFTTVE